MSWALPLKGRLLSKGTLPIRLSNHYPTTWPIARSGLTRSLSIPRCSRMEDSTQTKIAQLQAELDSLHKAITVLNQLAAELDIHTAMQNVRQVALELLDCERVTLFLIFERRRELRAMIDQNEILRIQFGEGIAGLVAQTGGSMNLPDVYAHPMFNKEVDRITGFRTRSMLCMAVSDMTGKNVAVLQALNKKSGQPFTPADERNLKLFGTHLGNTLVKAKLHETANREKERLQAIYNCFKTLSISEEVGQMVDCAIASLERHVIHADRVYFFLVDKPRGELWLHTHQGDPMRLRMGQHGGVVGVCAESKKPQSWAEFEDPSKDPALRRLAPQLSPARIKSVLVQPIHGSNNDRVLAVVLALNKREAEGTSDIFFEPFFTDADCDAMALFAYEVGDLLSERSLELSLLSALSVVGHDGAHPNVARTSVGGGGDGGADGDSDGGVPSSGLGDEDLIRSQLIQMYLPEYKKEIPSAHGVFNRNSFSAANATANQVRASMERKRSALFGGDGQNAKRGSTRQREVVSAGGRLGLVLAAATARSSLWGPFRVQSRQSGGGDEDAGSGGTLGLATAAAGGSWYGTEPPGSPAMTSDASGDLTFLHDLGALRCHSSTRAEHPSFAMRFGGGGGGMAPAARAAVTTTGMRSGRSLTTTAVSPSATLTHTQALLLHRSGGAPPLLARPNSGSHSSAGAAAATAAKPPPSPREPGQRHVGGGGGSGGEGSARPGGRPTSAMSRLMAPWRRPLHLLAACSASAGSGGPSSFSGDSSVSGEDDELAAGGGRVRQGGRGGVDGSDAMAAAAAAAEGAGGEGREVAAAADGNGGEQPGGRGPGAGEPPANPQPHSHHQHRQQRHRSHADAHAQPQEREQAAPPLLLQLPALEAPYSSVPLGSLDSVEEELRRAVDASMTSAVADPQALRTHLSCTTLTQAVSPRSPCFYPLEQLCSWDWDFTEYSVEELIKLAYDIFIVSGAMEEFALKPKVLRNFLTAVASHYHAIPYHNFNHVVHVLHATFLISTTTRVLNVLKPVERLALLLAALCHDLDHDGHSNSFHINSGSELSRIYNDQSVMENHHCAMTFAILSRTDCNMLAVLAPEEQRAVRKVVISAILCTDMANHFSLTQEFQKHGVGYDSDNEADRVLLLKVILHAADIGNAVRPFQVNHAMSRRVHREFEAQASEEVRLGLAITFSVDTSDHIMCARVELNFLDYVVSALWERLVDVLPELSPQLSQLRVNRARYRRIADTGKTADQVLAEEVVGQQADVSAGDPEEPQPQPQPQPRPGPGSGSGSGSQARSHSGGANGTAPSLHAACNGVSDAAAGAGAASSGPEDMVMSPKGPVAELRSQQQAQQQSEGSRALSRMESMAVDTPGGAQEAMGVTDGLTAPPPPAPQGQAEVEAS